VLILTCLASDSILSGSVKWSSASGPGEVGRGAGKIAEMTNPPKQFYAGSDAVAGIRSALESRLQEIKTHEALSRSTDGTF
jgi:hypothetical protein